MENPFSISFGRINERIIQRDQEIEPIFEDFNATNTRNTVYILTGPRGCGKTVTLSHILDIYREKPNWIVARLTQSSNMLEQLASILYEGGINKIKSLNLEFSFSFSGISFKVSGDKPTTSIHVYLEKLLKYYDSKNIHVLVTIDDVSKSSDMVEFIRTYQGFLIDHLDVRLLMTGLYKNISKLESDKTLTFLFRAPKIKLSNLSIKQIAYSYQNTFNITEEESIKLSKFTLGYAMAYQLLGDILFRNKETSLSDKVIKEFDLKINDWSYEIIWRELSDSEKNILISIVKGNTTNQSIMSDLNISKGNLAIYKKRLIDEGIINCNRGENIEFNLPRFSYFIDYQMKLLLE